ncbi:MAG: magnesium transporter [Alphaproteobacteria bacterium]|nr:magnesium transporter [Alphaproteobacteria bacterium]
MTEPMTDAPVTEGDKVLAEEEKLTGIGDDLIRAVADAVQDKREDEVSTYIQSLSEIDCAELLEKFSEDDRRAILSAHADEIDPYTFFYLDPELRKNTLSVMPADKVARIVSELDSDDALDMVLNLDPDFQREVIRKLSYRTRIVLQEGLNFPEDSAGRLMQREFVAIPQFWTVGKTIDYLRAATEELPEDFFDIFVIDPGYHIVGEIPLNRLVRSKRSEKIESLKLDTTHPIPATMDQEEVAHIFRREELSSAPVVDDSGRLIGVITIDDIVDVIDEEAQEDILRLSGVEGGDLYRAFWSTTASRFRWLAVNLLTAIFASWIISFFDTTLDQLVALAILMPIVASMGGNAGTQALTVAVRALATRELSDANALRIIWKETAVGTLNGIAFAIITGIVAGLWFQNPMLGGVIGVAMVVNLFCAGLFGAGIPIVLHRMGSDPAVSSTVFLTTVTDVVGFFAFLGLAALLLI